MCPTCTATPDWHPAPEFPFGQCLTAHSNLPTRLINAFSPGSCSIQEQYEVESYFTRTGTIMPKKYVAYYIGYNKTSPDVSVYDWQVRPARDS
jgi:hypothetical protein